MFGVALAAPLVRPRGRQAGLLAPHGANSTGSPIPTGPRSGDFSQPQVQTRLTTKFQTIATPMPTRFAGTKYALPASARSSGSNVAAR